MGGGEGVSDENAFDWTPEDEGIFDEHPKPRPGKVATSKLNGNRTFWVDEGEIEFGEWHGTVIYSPGTFSPGLRSAVCRGKPYTHMMGRNPVLIPKPGRFGHEGMVAQAVYLLNEAQVTVGWIKAVMPIVLGSPHVDAMTKMRLATRFPEAGA